MNTGAFANCMAMCTVRQLFYEIETHLKDEKISRTLRLHTHTNRNKSNRCAIVKKNKDIQIQ